MPLWAFVLLTAVLGERGIPSARAQTSSLQQAMFNTQTFRPTLGVGNLFTVQGTQLPLDRWPLGAVVLEVASRPLRLVIQDTRETYAATVPATFTAHLLAGAGITRWLSAALALPVVLYQGFDSRTPTSDVPNNPTVAGVGDLRLLTKFHLLSKNGFGLAAVPEFTFPTGSQSSFRGDNTFGIEPRLAADYRFKNGIFIAANLGVYVRTYNRTVDYDLVRVSDQIRYGFGAGVPLPKGFAVSAELTGAAGLSKLVGGPLYTPLEWYAGARYALQRGLELSAGVGGGLVGAVGSPNFRFFAGVSYALPGGRAAPARREVEPARAEGTSAPELATRPTAPGPDADQDGVTDKDDRCPREPGPAANGGCPDRDEDKDGVVDRLDKCPKQPGPKEGKGCPLLTIDETSMTLALPLRFQAGSIELDTASRPTVAALVTAWLANPTIKRVLISVTASGTSHHATRKLATRRARALSELLVAAGAAADLLAITPVGEPGSDEVTRIDLVREAATVKAEPAKAEPSKSEPIKSEPSKSEPSKSEPIKSEPESPAPKRHHHSRQEPTASSDEDEEGSAHHHRGKRSHHDKSGKAKKSDREKRHHH